MNIVVAGFDWDLGNRTKCQKHGLTIYEIERFFLGEVEILSDPKHSQEEDRFIAVGRALNGRPVVVGFTFRTKGGETLLRPISARYMHLKEVLKYEKATSKT